MINLLINNPDKNNPLNETSIGGLPVKEIGNDIEWPKCKTCKGDMQYQGKVKTNIGLELIFMCQNDPGMCEDWEPDGGGNKVIIIDSNNVESFTPDNPKGLVREDEYQCKMVSIEANDYEDATENEKVISLDVLGQLFGVPEWIQGDETPTCDCCDTQMRFVAQLEEGPDFSVDMNFGGGGIAYLFDCEKGKTAKFLWQC